MKLLLSTTALALFLGTSALAQTDQRQKPDPYQDHMSGKQMRSQPKLAQTQPPLPEAPKPAESTEKATPEEQQGMPHMEMHNPKDITSDVVGVQEPENPNQRTGSN